MAKKTNPKSIPRTQADVDRALDKGIIIGLHEAEILFLTVLLDKHEHEIDINQVWDEMVKIEIELGEGRISMADLATVLKEEYGIIFEKG